jgi:hypothetical protein
MINVNCAICEKEIKRFNKDIKENKSGKFFCSKECLLKKYSLATTISQCLFCGKECTRTLGELKKSPNVYCSVSCANKHKPRHKPLGRTCEKCEQKYIKTQNSIATSHYCESCVSESRLRLEAFKFKTIKECQEMESVQNKPRHWINVHIRMFNQSWNKDLKKLPCQNCRI